MYVVIYIKNNTLSFIHFFNDLCPVFSVFHHVRCFRSEHSNKARHIILPFVCMKFCLLYVINVKYLTFYNVRYTIRAYDIGTKCMNNGCSEPEPCLRGSCASWLLSDYA